MPLASSQLMICLRLIFLYLEKTISFFVHGFYDKNVLKFLYKKIRRFKKNQLVLICWGADIYNARYMLEDHKLHLGLRLYEMRNKEYGQKVIEYGKRLFKEKFKPILNYMSAEEYSKLLNSVQVAVFNHNRQ